MALETISVNNCMDMLKMFLAFILLILILTSLYSTVVVGPTESIDNVPITEFGVYNKVKGVPPTPDVSATYSQHENVDYTLKQNYITHDNTSTSYDSAVLLPPKDSVRIAEGTAEKYVYTNYNSQRVFRLEVKINVYEIDKSTDGQDYLLYLSDNDGNKVKMGSMNIDQDKYYKYKIETPDLTLNNYNNILITYLRNGNEVIMMLGSFTR